MVYTTAPLTATASTTTSIPEAKGECLPHLDATFKAALEHARRLTSMFGANNAETAIAWETVEELGQAKIQLASFATETLRDAFLRYCDENPSAPEARIYDN